MAPKHSSPGDPDGEETPSREPGGADTAPRERGDAGAPPRERGDAAESAGERARAAAGDAGARAWTAAHAVAARLRPPLARYGPVVVLWLAGAGLILSEFLTYREIVAVTVVPEGGITKGGEHHGYALALLGLASLPMAFGAVIGRSRPASAAVAVLGALALVIIAVFDVSSLDDTGLIGRTYDLAEANPGAGFWLSVACAAVLLLGGLLLLASRVRSAREQSEARRSRRRARRAAEIEAPPPDDAGTAAPDAVSPDAGASAPAAGAPDAPRERAPSGARAASARRPTRPR